MPNQHNNIWNHEKVRQLFTLRDEQYSFDEIAAILREKYKQPFTYSNCNSKYYRELPNKSTIMNDTYEKPFKEGTRLKDGGEIVEDDKLIQLTEKESKDPKYILEAHGFDPKEWEIINTDISRWHYRDKESPEAKISYASKLKVKPLNGKFKYEHLIEHIKQLQPINIDKQPLDETKHLLEIPIYDPHFPISTYDDYKESQTKILDKIESKQWDEILITLGSDMLHHDNMKNTTSNGTPIEHVDIMQGWEYARQFFEPIIEESIKQSKICKIIYVPGNHDESLSWAFTEMIKARYPQAIYDTEPDQWKVHRYHNNVIGFTHGDKARKNLHNVFMANFPKEWGEATVREIHCGHIHIEEVKDHYGTIVRSLATRNKTDKWHEQNGFLGAHKRFQIFEYSREGLESINYV